MYTAYPQPWVAQRSGSSSTFIKTLHTPNPVLPRVPPISANVRDMVPTEITEDRRKRRRYTLTLPLHFKVFQRKNVVVNAGAGAVINISSSGIAFTTQEFLPTGRRIELSIAWPILLDDTIPLKLVVEGGVVRSDGRVVAVEVSRYEFHTASRAMQSSTS
jgi:hypothetical protein